MVSRLIASMVQLLSVHLTFEVLTAGEFTTKITVKKLHDRAARTHRARHP